MHCYLQPVRRTAQASVLTLSSAAAARSLLVATALILLSTWLGPLGYGPLQLLVIDVAPFTSETF